MRDVKLLFFALAFGVSMSIASAAEKSNDKALNFLFMGNRFTSRNDLPTVFKTLAEEGHPAQSFATEMLTYGGRDLFRHYELFRSQDLLRLGLLTDEQFSSQ